MRIYTGRTLWAGSVLFPWLSFRCEVVESVGVNGMRKFAELFQTGEIRAEHRPGKKDIPSPVVLK